MPPKNMAEYADQELLPEARAQLGEEEDEDEGEGVQDESEEDRCEEPESEDDLACLARNPSALREQMESEVRQWSLPWSPEGYTQCHSE